MLHLERMIANKSRFSGGFSPQVWLLCAILMSAGVALAGCSQDTEEAPEGVCTTDDECPDDDSCFQGACIARDSSRCTTQAQCPSEAYICIESRCRLREFDAGSDATQENDGTSTPDTSQEDTGPVDPADPPRVLATDPADGAQGVSPDTTITVTFSKSMDPDSLNFYSMTLRDADSQNIDSLIDYDDTTHRATITPAAPLQPAEGYRLTINERAHDTSWNGVDPEVTVRFSTRYEEPPHHRTLAETWAPTIYQGISVAAAAESNPGDGDPPGAAPRPLPATDIPARLDFDGNLSARDNLTHSVSAADQIPAAVYYQVSESTQYYFLHYILYYPSRYHAENDTLAEHDFSGLVVVIDKASETLRMVESVSLTDSGQITLAFRPDSSPVRSLGGDVGTQPLRAFPDDQLEDATHFPLYVRAGVHEACHWHQSGHNGQCLHTAGQFPEDGTTGVIMRPGEAQTFAQATPNNESGVLEMTYELVPFATGFWTVRDRLGDDGLFELAFPYRPQGADRPTGAEPDQRRMLPRKLLSDADATFGRTPFSWLASAGQNNEGQWLLDPVYILPNRYRFGETVTTDYCYNLFFGIAPQSDTSQPGCAP